MDDTARGRPAPALLSGEASNSHPKPLAILSYPYGGHAGTYGFIARDLVRRGYLVVAIEHLEHLERPGDPPLVMDGDKLAVRRRPNWQVGADTIDFVLEEMLRRGVARRSPKPVVIGHSHGGDMTMLFATQHPDKVRVALSLGNRRMPLPRTRHPRICSLRSSDQQSDPGVFPPAAEQATLNMRIAPVPVLYNDMWDGATGPQKQAMLDAIHACFGG